jgi:hypothetical protein
VYGGSNSASPFTAALGYQAANSTTGANNVAVGAQSMFTNTTGSNNVAVGFQSLYTNSTGSNGTAVGRYALYNSTAGNNSAFGNAAMFATTTGQYNSALGGIDASGTGVMAANLGGNYNTGVGAGALGANTSSNQNVGIGYQAGANVTGANNLCIGYVAGTDAVRNITSGSNEIVMGNNSNTAAYIKVSWTVTSDARDKTSFAPVPHGLNFINSLAPTAYQFRESREEDIPTGPIRYGFLAQDVLAAEGDSPIIIDNSDPENLKYNADSMVAVLVNAIKDLSAANEALTARIAALEAK